MAGASSRELGDGGDPGATYTVAAVPGKRRIYFTGFSAHAGQALPLTYGVLRAYAEMDERVRENYVFERVLFGRETPEEALGLIEHPFLFCVSLYIWNFALS